MLSWTVLLSLPGVAEQTTTLALVAASDGDDNANDADEVADGVEAIAAAEAVEAGEAGALQGRDGELDEATWVPPPPSTTER